jgi:hypothetical protein
MQPEQVFWQEMPANIHTALTESDKSFDETISTAMRLLMKCHDNGLSWPVDVGFDESCMYLSWDQDEITIFEEKLYINALYACGSYHSIAYVVTHLLFVKQ